MKRIVLALLCLLFAAPTGAYQTPWPDASSGSGANPFKLASGYLTEDSRIPMAQLSHPLGLEHLQKIYFSPGAVASGTASGAGSTTTLVTSGLTVDELVGMTIRFGNEGSGGDPRRVHRVTSNTATVITFTPPTQVATASGDVFEVYEGLLPPGDDTTGDGSMALPFQTTARMNTAIKEPDVLLTLDCATWTDTRDAGGTWQIQTTGLTGAECPDGNRVCNGMTTLEQCGFTPARFLTENGANLPQGFLITNASGESRANKIWTVFANISWAGPDDPESEHDFYRNDNAATSGGFLLNVTCENMMGHNNQCATSHAGDDSAVFTLNLFAVVGDAQGYAGECQSDSSTTGGPGGEDWDACSGLGVMGDHQVPFVSYVNGQNIDINAVGINYETGRTGEAGDMFACGNECHDYWLVWSAGRMTQTVAHTGATVRGATCNPDDIDIDADCVFVGNSFVGMTPATSTDSRGLNHNNQGNDQDLYFFAYQNTLIDIDNGFDLQRDGTDRTGVELRYDLTCNVIDDMDTIILRHDNNTDDTVSLIARYNTYDEEAIANPFEFNNSLYATHDALRTGNTICAANSQASGGEGCWESAETVVIGATAPSNALPNKGLCISADCDDCLVDFKRDFPADSGWGSVLGRDILGLDEDVKGLWVNRGLDMKRGSPLGSSPEIHPISPRGLW